MRIFLVSLVLGIVAFMLLFSGGMSVGAIPNTPTSQPTATTIPAYFNLTSVSVDYCNSAGGRVSFNAAAHTAGGVPVVVEWYGFGVGSTFFGDVLDGSLTISANGGVYGTVNWWVNQKVYWEYLDYYAFYLRFELYRYLPAGEKILVDRADVRAWCYADGTKGATILANQPD